MTQLNLFDTTFSAAVVLPSRPESTNRSEAPAGAERQRDDHSLRQLAELIRQGREQLQGQRGRERAIQPIGQLAQEVLRRHDLVSRRRAAADQLAPQQAVNETKAVWVNQSAGNDRLSEPCQIAS